MTNVRDERTLEDLAWMLREDIRAVERRCPNEYEPARIVSWFIENEDGEMVRKGDALLTVLEVSLAPYAEHANRDIARHHVRSYMIHGQEPGWGVLVENNMQAWIADAVNNAAQHLCPLCPSESAVGKPG
jgi:hypothetical protein